MKNQSKLQNQSDAAIERKKITLSVVSVFQNYFVRD